jgi:arylsulfatase A-like enzyme
LEGGDPADVGGSGHRRQSKITSVPRQKQVKDIAFPNVPLSNLVMTRAPLAVFLLALLVCLASATRADASKPNVVLIYIDDLGYGDVGCYGCTDIPTPNIDRLADEGVRCTTSYITNPPCCPSRCSQFMGQYGQKFGKYGMSRGLPIPTDRPTLAEFLRDHGYVTGQIGKWDIGTRRQGPLQTGFTEVARVPPKKQYSAKDLAALPADERKQLSKKGSQSKYFCINEDGETVWLTDYDGNLMVDFVGRHRAEPFYLYWSPEAVHSSNKEAPARLMDRTTAKGQRRKLAGAIVSVDDQVGKLIEVLEQHDLREKTLVIFSSDNGANGGEGGTSTPYTGGKGSGTQKEGWVRVPTIFSMPGVLPEGRDYHGMIANFDFYSTIASVVGETAPGHCDGVDLIPYLSGEMTGDAHEYLFWLNNEPGDAERRHLIAARWQDWRLYRKYEADQWQLFDLRKDPREENNVATEHPDVVQTMAAEHASWVKTLSPLGTIPDVSRNGPVIPSGHGWATPSTETK